MLQKEKRDSLSNLLSQEFRLDLDSKEVFAIDKDLKALFELLIKYDQHHEKH